MRKRITIIINPASGKKDSILWSINTAFHKKDIDWEISITKQKGDAYRFAKEAVKNKKDIVAAYGGDGTICEVAKALFKTTTPLFILPGGSANVFAKELGIPTNIDQALTLLARPQPKIKTMDMAMSGKEPFVLRIEAGLSALTIKETKRSSKRIFGQFSYFPNLFKHIHHTNKYTFDMQLDGNHISESGVGLMVSNVGNVGIKGYSLVPQCKIDDGLLDVIIYKEKNLETIFSWIKSHVMQTKPQGSIKYWKAKKVKIRFKKEQTVIFDDIPIKTSTIEAEIIPRSLRIIVP